MLVDSGIGSDLNDFNTKISKIGAFMDKDRGLAKIELENLRQSLFLIANETNPKHLSFVPLIHKINGKLLTDLSDENIKRVLDRLGSIKKSRLDQLIDSVKKKIDQELEVYFPSNFGGVKAKEFYASLKDQTLLKLDQLIRGTDNLEKIKEIDNFLLTIARPQVFSGSSSVEITYDKKFDKMCLLLSKELKIDPDNITTFQFYNSFEYLKELHKNNKPNGRKSHKV